MPGGQAAGLPDLNGKGAGPPLLGSLFSGVRSCPVLLKPCRAQPGKPMAVDGELPGQKFIHGQRVALTSFVEGKEPAANRRYDFRFAPDDPALCCAGRQIGHGQGAPVRTDDIFGPDTI